MATHITTQHGKIVLHDRVLENLAGMATTECYGVAGMAVRNLQDGLAAILGQENLSRGVNVKFLTDENALEITVNIVVGYGVNISEVGRNIRETVRYVVMHGTGFPVSRVIINVQGVKVTAFDD